MAMEVSPANSEYQKIVKFQNLYCYTINVHLSMT